MNIQGIAFNGNDAELFRALTENIDDIFYRLDAHLHGIYWNRKAEIITGVTAEDILHHFLCDFFPEMRDNIASKVFNQTIKNRRKPTFQTNIYPGR